MCPVARPDRVGRPLPRRRSSPATACWPRTSARALHVCHVSTAGSVELIRWAKSKGWDGHRRGHPAPPAADRRPGHRPTTRSSRSTRRCAPSADVGRAARGLADGTIDAVATDHAPHPLEDKETEWNGGRVRHDRPRDRALGRRGSRWSTPGCSTGRASPTGCPFRPARIGRLASPRPDPVEAGAHRPTWCWSTAVASAGPSTRMTRTRRSRNTPFAGMSSCRAGCMATFLRGTRDGSGRKDPYDWCERDAGRLEDGTKTCATASPSAPSGESFGEVVFNTGMTGYQETLTDPSVPPAEIVAMTTPHIGNTGVNDDRSGILSDLGLGLRDARALAGWPRATWRRSASLDAELEATGISRRDRPIVSPAGADDATCADIGAMRAGVSSTDEDQPERHCSSRVRGVSPVMAGADLARPIVTTAAAVHGRARRPAPGPGTGSPRWTSASRPRPRAEHAPPRSVGDARSACCPPRSTADGDARAGTGRRVLQQRPGRPADRRVRGRDP